MPEILTSPMRDGKTVLLQVDGLGSIVAERGFRQGEWSFPPYGQLPPQRVVGALRFAGQWFDPVVRSYLLGNGHRLYSPAIMRFLSPDSLSPFGAGGINVYAYCSGDPVNSHDPSGRSKFGLTKLLQDHGLPKPPLRDYLKPLGRLKNIGQRREVYRLNGDNFEKFEFMGAGEKIIGAKRNDRSVLSVALNSEDFYRSGELYIPESTVPERAIEGLLNAGFQRVRFDTDFLAELIFREGASSQTGEIANSTLHRQNNLYTEDPVGAVARTRTRN
ncbi:RHS repeat-associated core domain-containing protein [Pseudomonas vlassakiae]|uniref:RHS repeat-associated core domain-containing protein n=1 Tax=Pseudomonas vlassakiae TaxID=485888 RepID=A0A923K728_9PSED|nr:RHS repeat-associated core domain-containing protein [Pseudomonas vlassakiae]MBV4543463.1 RHS repeat-associated core domain-containing protein [Pseudomonas vlassakiae]